MLECTAQGTDEGDDGTADGEQDGAGAVLSQDVQHDTEGQDMGGHQEDKDKDLQGLDSPASWATKDQLGGIGKAVQPHVLDFELVKDIAGVARHDAEYDDEQHAPGWLVV